MTPDFEGLPLSREHPLVLLGGGIDSVTAMIYARENLAGKVDAIHFQYGQKAAERELEACDYFCKKYAIRLKVVELDLSQVGSSAIMAHPWPGDMSRKNMFEGRNAILVMMAATWAATQDNQALILGYHAEPLNAPFPDATNAAVRGMQACLNTCYSPRIRLYAPFGLMERIDVVRRALEIDPEIMTHSHTCYDDIKGGCGHCVHCQQKAAMIDHVSTGKKLMMPENA